MFCIVAEVWQHKKSDFLLIIGWVWGDLWMVWVVCGWFVGGLAGLWVVSSFTANDLTISLSFDNRLTLVLRSCCTGRELVTKDTDPFFELHSYSTLPNISCN